jgi:large subunit ribosomal protein L15
MDYELKAPKGANKKKIILGRGKGARRGRACGKGHDGQNSRSGGGVRLGFEGGQMPLYRRIAVRGFSNYPFKKESVAVNLREIAKKYEEGETVSPETLKVKGLLKGKKRFAKVLSEGDLDKKLVFKGISISKKAAEKIQAAGGSIETVEKGETVTARENTEATVTE